MIMYFFLFLGMTMQMIEKVSRYNCNFCDRQFNYEDLLNKHQKAAHQVAQNAEPVINSNQSNVQQNSSFKCNVCQKGFAKNYKLKRHFDADHLKIKPFKCEKCNKCFGQNAALIFHDQNIHSILEKDHLHVHDSEKKKLCHKCNKSFSSRKKLVRHNSMVHLNLRPYSCNICEKSFKLKEHLKRHSQVHEKDTSEQVLQLEESNSESNQEHFEELQNQKVPSNMKFKCNRCNKEFKGKKHLSQHTKYVHDKLESHECNKCVKTFVNISKLKRHDSVVHQKIKPFSCDKCKFSFALKYDFDKHLLSKSHQNVIISETEVTSNQGNSEHEEPIDTREFLQEDSQTIQIVKEIDPQNKENEVLSNQYNLESDANESLKDSQAEIVQDFAPQEYDMHSDQDLYRNDIQQFEPNDYLNARDENPAHENARSELPLQVTYSNSKIKCDICDKTFPKNCKLKRHYEAVHMKLKPFKCEFCQQNFTQKGDMKRHVESIHQQAEIYECSLCSKIFTSVKDFKLHYVKIHTDFTPPKENPNKEHFACNHCSIKFPRKSTLNGHINTVHLKIKQNSCGVCSKTFSTSRDLKRHNDMVHLKIKPFSCNQCEMKFTLKQHLKRHMLSHKSKENISKKNRSIPVEHYKDVQNVVEIEQSNSFENVTYLDEKESDSDDCIFEKKIIIEENGNNLIDDNEKNFQCTSCGKGFYERYMLIKHYDTKHRGNVTLIVNVLQK